MVPQLHMDIIWKYGHYATLMMMMMMVVDHTHTCGCLYGSTKPQTRILGFCVNTLPFVAGRVFLSASDRRSSLNIYRLYFVHIWAHKRQHVGDCRRFRFTWAAFSVCFGVCATSSRVCGLVFLAVILANIRHMLAAMRIYMFSMFRNMCNICEHIIKKTNSLNTTELWFPNVSDYDHLVYLQDSRMCAVSSIIDADICDKMISRFRNRHVFISKNIRSDYKIIYTLWNHYVYFLFVFHIRRQSMLHREKAKRSDAKEVRAPGVIDMPTTFSTTLCELVKRLRVCVCLHAFTARTKMRCCCRHRPQRRYAPQTLEAQEIGAPNWLA